MANTHVTCNRAEDEDTSKTTNIRAICVTQTKARS